MHDATIEDSTLQLVIDQIEELVVTVIEEVRERPGIVMALAAGLLGALVGIRLAGRRNRPAPVRAARKARRVGDAAELAGLGLRLLQNPIVRGMIVVALQRQLKRRIAG